MTVAVLPRRDLAPAATPRPDLIDVAPRAPSLPAVTVQTPTVRVRFRTPRTAITIYGATEDLAGIDTTAQLRYVPIDGMEWEPGSSAFGCGVHNGTVYVGVLTASTNSLNYTYRNATLHAFDPIAEVWTVIPIETDLGFSGTDGANAAGFTACDIPTIAVTAGKAVAIAVWDYNGWNIGTYGRYPAWFELDGTTIGTTYTVPELRANAADGNGALSFPDSTNSFAETYASQRGMAAASVLPNGWLAVVDYFAIVASGIYSGRMKVFDTDGVQQGFYQWPDMETVDHVALQMAPKFISTDPSSTDPTDYRVIVNFDTLLRGTSTSQPFVIQEMAIDTTTGAITPVCAPVSAISRDQTAAFTDYTGRYSARPVFSDDGTCWASTAVKGTFNQRAMGVWLKSGGERRWAAENPPTAGWELEVGKLRVVPDFELGVLHQDSDLHSGEYIDPTTGGHVVVGAGGGVFPFFADSPLVLRTSLIANPGFDANVTGWGAFSNTGAVAWEATDGGRLKFTGNGTAGNGTWQSPAGVAFNNLPADSEGQSLWAWARFKPNSTARSVQVQVTYYDSGGTQVDFTNGPTAIESTGAYTTATCPSAVPVGAVKFRVFCRVIGGGVNGEIHYSDGAHCSIAPVTHMPSADLNLNVLPREPGTFRWPAGSSSRDAVDGDGVAWCPITVLGSSTSRTPQYLARLDLPQLLGEPVTSQLIQKAGTAERPRINFRSWAAAYDLVHTGLDPVDVGAAALTTEAGDTLTTEGSDVLTVED
jgi:hypothetical protein